MELRPHKMSVFRKDKTKIKESSICLTAAFLLITITYWAHISGIFNNYALRGFGPMGWVAKLNKSSDFISDFPSGIENYKSSLFMWIYPLLNNAFNINPEVILPIVVFLEVASLMLSITFLTKTLFPKASYFLLIACAILPIASNLGLIDLSRIWVYPYFAGLYYTAADSTRLLAVAFAFRKNWFICFTLLAFSTSTHPIMGGLGYVSVLVIAFATLRKKIFKGDFIVPFAGSLVLVLLWLYFTGTINKIPLDAKIPNDIWISFTKAQNCHWYPGELGMFTTLFDRHLLPFIMYTSLFFYYWKTLREEICIKYEDSYLFCFVTLLIISIIGLIIPSLSDNPTLIKLNLTRASMLAAWVGIPLVVLGLHHDLLKGNILQICGVILIVSSLFMSIYPIPILGVILILSERIVNSVQEYFCNKKIKCISSSLLLLLIILCALYEYHVIGALSLERISGYKLLSNWTLFALILLFIIFKKKKLNQFMTIGFAFLFVVGSILYNYNLKSTLSANQVSGIYFKEAQQWARANTPGNSLFWVDPTIAYGWRDFSQRSSFGCAREWLHTSWGYNSDFGIYTDAIDRCKKCGVDPLKYIKEEKSFMQIYEVIGDFFYYNPEGRKKIAEFYGVTYFVYNKTKDPSFPGKVVYENEQYIISAIN